MADRADAIAAFLVGTAPADVKSALQQRFGDVAEDDIQRGVKLAAEMLDAVEHAERNGWEVTLRNKDGRTVR